MKDSADSQWLAYGYASSTRLDTPHGLSSVFVFVTASSRTHSLCCAPELGAVAGAAAPLTACQGHLQVGAAAAAAPSHALVTCAPQ